MGVDTTLETDVFNGESGHAAKHNAVNAQVNFLTGQLADLDVPAQIEDAINNLINGAPGALDTLKEIADQLAADEGAAGAITTLINAIRNLTDATFAAALSASIAAALPPLVVRGLSTNGGAGAANSTALQAAYNTAATTGQIVEIPSPLTTGTYTFATAVQIKRHGQITRGQTGYGSVTLTMSGTGNLFEIPLQAADGISTGFALKPRFEHLYLIGPGKATSTGAAIYANGNGDDTYSGDLLSALDLTIIGFNYGIYLGGWDQSTFEQTWVRSCNYGYYSAGNANNLTFIDSGAGLCGTGLRIKNGGGVRLFTSDFASNDLCMDFGTDDGSGVVAATLIGGNFEKITGSGTEFVTVRNGSSLLSSGTRFGKIGGNEPAAMIRAKSGSSVEVRGAIVTGFASTTPTVLQEGTGTARVWDRGMIGFATGGGVSDGTTQVRETPFRARNETGLPTAIAANRGLLVQVLGRDSGSYADKLLQITRTGGGTSSAYQLKRLDADIIGSGTPNGVQQGKVGDRYINETPTSISDAVWFKVTGDNTNTGWVALGATGAAGPAGGLQAGDAIRSMWGAGAVIRPGGTIASVAFANQSLQVSPVPVPYNGGNPWTITDLAVDVVSAPTGTGGTPVYRFTVYGPHATTPWFPGSLLYEGTVALSSAAVKSISSVALSIADNLGHIWVGGVLQGADTTVGTLRAIGTPPWTLPSLSNDIATAGRVSFGYAKSAADVSGSAPSTFPAPASSTPVGNPPRVHFKLS